MDLIYKKYYTTEILEKIEKFGHDEECSFHSIDCDDQFDLDADVVAIPTPQEFFDWLLSKDKFYISIIPEDDYTHGTVFRYNIYKRDYKDHFNLKLTKANFRTHNEAVENAVYDLLVNFEPK
jgi:hypothetical protein